MPFDASPTPQDIPVTRETEPDVFSMLRFKRWLEEQVARGRGEEVYCYISVGGCLLHQYFSDCGFENVVMGVNGFDAGPSVCRRRAYDGVADFPQMNRIARGIPRTFGAALARAHSLRATGKG